jgi:tetratricopeptide (TPR) repeat protein
MPCGDQIQVRQVKSRTSNEGEEMPKVFISYRRSDTQMVAGRLRESLARRLGEESIFRDKDSIGAGEDWTKAIKASLSGDVVVLALIGPGWATARDETGGRRLDDPADWNRVELEQALNGAARVIPLVVDETKMPRESDLPESLRPLARSNALKLRDDDWDSDIERLTRAIGTRGISSRMRRLAVVAIACAVIVGGGAGYWWLGFSDGTGNSVAQPERRASATSGKDIRGKFYKDLEEAFNLLNSSNPADKAKAIGVVDVNVERINIALESFPDDAYLHALAGYAAKNVFESSRENNLLSAEQRQKYLAQARKHFEAALKIDPGDASALNGMGNVSFYEGKFDTAIRYHELAIKEAGSRGYPNAEQDLSLVKRVKSGAVAFRP